MKAAPCPQPLLTFGQCLKQLLTKRKLSASALSRMMEQKSRNSIFRILDDTSGPAAQTAFYESLIASDCLSLTQEEKDALSRSLEVSRVGAAGYRSNQAMHRLLGDVDIKPQTDVPFRVDRSSDGSRTTFEEAMQRMARENPLGSLCDDRLLLSVDFQDDCGSIHARARLQNQHSALHVHRRR